MLKLTYSKIDCLCYNNQVEIDRRSLEKLTTSLSVTLLGLLTLTLTLVVSNYVFGWDLFPKSIEKIGLVIILSVLIGLELAGFWGLLLAIPVAVVLMELFNDIEKHHLENISSLKTRISQIKQLEVGETVGYNRKGVASKKIFFKFKSCLFFSVKNK